MAIQEVAEGLVELCKEGKFVEASEKYYSPDIVSVEPMGEPRISTGLEAVLGKAQWWFDHFDFHSVEVLGPYIHGDQFSVHFKVDITDKKSGERSFMNEIALYTVKDDKIIHEAFFA